METAVIGEVTVFPDLAALSRQAADFFVQRSRESVADHAGFTVALSGGTTPGMFYALLGTEPYRTAVAWKQVHLFWADERMVPPDDQDSNFMLAFTSFIEAVRLPEGNIHRIKGETDAEAAARDYDRQVRDFFGREEFPIFDLIILGMGGDGHTASLFPGSDALSERNRIAVPVHRRAPDHDRVTLTLPVLNNSVHVLFLISGKNKAAVLRSVLEKDHAKYPAGLVTPARGKLHWFVDRDAATGLGKS